jgi:hypothetical protein
MAERRSLSNAMDITPEKLAFIQGIPEPTPMQTVAPAIADDSQAISKPRKRRVPRPSTRTQQPESDVTHQQTPPSLLGALLVPLTTRLQPNTADALRRAYLEQKLSRRQPATQQEIVEAALADWLIRHGYLADSKR